LGGVEVKLGYVCQYFTQEYGGPVTSLMHELSKDVDVVNYSSVGRHMQYHAGGVHSDLEVRLGDRLTLRRYGVWFGVAGLVYPRNLTGLLSADRPDVVQSEEYYQPASHVSFRYARRNNVPFIFNHRGSEVRARSLRERVYFSIANPLSRSLVRGSDAIVCISEAGRRVLCGVYPEAEPKVHVIPNSIDPSRYSGADGRSFRGGHGIPESSPLLLCVARLHRQKRIDLLVRAFAEVKRQSPDSVLCVVGPWFEAEKRRMDSLVSRLKVDDVLFTGPIPNERVKDAYAAADVVALTSEYEPFGYCLLEAMCLSKPVVAFGVGAVPEIVEDGRSGFTVHFGDAEAFAGKVVGLFGDRQMSRRFGLRGRRLVDEKFLLSDNAERLVRLYGGLTGR